MSKRKFVDSIRNFIVESNRIEGIFDADRVFLERPTYGAFLNLDVIRVGHFAEALAVIQPGAVLRDKPGLDVIVGNHRPPPGGPRITLELENLLVGANEGDTRPYVIHRGFETLHPFTDGNGRTGRLLWLWQMVNHECYDLSRGFLHEWYYQSLRESRP